MKTLIVQFADLGDLILAAPAIRWVVRDTDGNTSLLTNPGNRLLADAWVPAVMRTDKHVFDRLLSLLNPRAVMRSVGLIWWLRREKFDRILVLHHLTTRFGAIKFAALTVLSGVAVRCGLDNGRGWFLNDAFRDFGFGAATEREYWTWLSGGVQPFEFPSDGDGAAKLCGRLGISNRYVILHPGSGLYSVARRWPAHHFRRLAALIRSQLDCAIVVVGGSDEVELAAEVAREGDYIVNVAGETNLPILVSLLRGAVAFVGNDGGVAQVAGVLDVPRIVIFGPTGPKTWHVPSKRARAVTLDLSCSPCVYHHHDLGTPAGCLTRECLVALSPDLVVCQLLDLIHGSAGA